MDKAILRMPVLFVTIVVCSAVVHAQDARLQIAHLNKLAEKAVETVEVDLDERLIQLAAKFLDSSNVEEAQIKELVSGLKGVYVRVYQFDKLGDYSANDVEAIRTQLRVPGWSRIVGVRSRNKNENVDVYVRMQGENVAGLAIITAEPKELAVINIVGFVDLEKLRKLEGQFGIPKLELDNLSKPKVKKD